MFSFLSRNKKERRIELSNSSDLPRHGWIQFCKHCDAATCQIFEYKKIETNKTIYTFMVYLCKICKRKDIINNEYFRNKLNEYINTNYLPVEPNPPDPL